MQTCQYDFFLLYHHHRLFSALKNVIRSLLHSQFEEIQECRLGRHLLELLDLSARLSRQEKIANSSTVASCLNLRLNIGSLRKFLRCCGVQLLNHVRFQRFGPRFVAHQLDGGRSAEAGDEKSSLHFHVCPLSARFAASITQLNTSGHLQRRSLNARIEFALNG